MYSGKETANDLRPELLRVLLDVSICDRLMYDRMVELFMRQLEVLHSTAGGL